VKSQNVERPMPGAGDVHIGKASGLSETANRPPA
jgi:hypothetical protein